MGQSVEIRNDSTVELYSRFRGPETASINFKSPFSQSKLLETPAISVFSFDNSGVTLMCTLRLGSKQVWS